MLDAPTIMDFTEEETEFLEDNFYMLRELILEACIHDISAMMKIRKREIIKLSLARTHVTPTQQ